MVGVLPGKGGKTLFQKDANNAQGLAAPAIRFDIHRKDTPCGGIGPDAKPLPEEGLEPRSRENGCCGTDYVRPRWPLAGMPADRAETQERLAIQKQYDLYHGGTYAPTMS